MNNDYEYSSYRDGKFVTVPELDKLFLQWKDKFMRMQERVDRLEEENKKLKDEHYKDSEIARLKEENDKYLKDIYRGFTISEEEEKAINKWKEEINKNRLLTKISFSYSYTFNPTPLGVAGTIIQSDTGKKFTFRELG